MVWIYDAHYALSARLRRTHAPDCLSAESDRSRFYPPAYFAYRWIFVSLSSRDVRRENSSVNRQTANREGMIRVVSLGRGSIPFQLYSWDATRGTDVLMYAVHHDRRDAVISI